MRLVLFLFVIVFGSPLFGEKLEVCSDCKFQDLAQAINFAKPFDTLLVKSGVYNCAELEIKKSLTILGEEGAVLDGGGKGYVLKLLADSIKLQGLEIINSGRSYTKDYAAVYVFRTQGVKIQDLVIKDPFFGILVEKSSNGILKNNRVVGLASKEDDAGNGIHLWHCRNYTVKDNYVKGQRDGIYLEFVDSSLVSNNMIEENVRYGLHFMFSNHDRYVENTFKQNGAGVAVMFSKFIRMERNSFVSNWGPASYGLLLKEIYDAEVLDNKFEKNTVAIFMDGTTRINFLENSFKQNGWAFKVTGGCYSNVVSRNDFVGNSFDVSYNSRINDNSFHGNYWGDYAGYDLDRDGKGDIPYRPMKLFSYIVGKSPESLLLIRSLFVDLVNFSERVSPIFTPLELVDDRPSIRPFK